MFVGTIGTIFAEIFVFNGSEETISIVGLETFGMLAVVGIIGTVCDVETVGTVGTTMTCSGIRFVTNTFENSKSFSAVRCSLNRWTWPVSEMPKMVG